MEILTQLPVLNTYSAVLVPYFAIMIYPPQSYNNLKEKLSLDSEITQLDELCQQRAKLLTYGISCASIIGFFINYSKEPDISKKILLIVIIIMLSNIFFLCGGINSDLLKFKKHKQYQAFIMFEKDVMLRVASVHFVCIICLLITYFL